VPIARSSSISLGLLAWRMPTAQQKRGKKSANERIRFTGQHCVRSQWAILLRPETSKSFGR
jgi:hypothetical protein